MTINRWKSKFGPLLALCLLSLAPWMARADAPAFTWVEGEAPASVSPASFKPEITSVGAPTLLSGGNWLHVAIQSGDVQKAVPAGGIVLTYKFAAPAAAPCEIWNRIGYEAARSPFDWRLDGGAWTTVSSIAQTVDLQQLQTWNPVAWLKLTTQPLTAGDHTLEIRLLPTKNDKGEVQSINYALDAICVSAGPFHPNDGYKPGDMGWMSDADRAAGAQTFMVPVPASPAQTPVSLKGTWQIARWDEGAVTDAAAPIAEAPSADSLFWKSMPVPSNRDADRPDWQYNHRYFLRTRVDVPAALTGHSFYLHFPAVSMIASVFVNGQLCGTTKAPFAVWDCDVTQALHPGVNEVWVGIKDWFYAIPLVKGADGKQYVNYEPADWVTKFGPATFNFPVWNHTENGILREPSLVVAGKAYVSDVFAIPSVKNKTLGLEVTVHNPTAQPVTVTLNNEAAPLAGGAVEKKFAPQDVTVPAGQDQVVKLSEAWANPKLWWPDTPTQYTLTTTLSAGGQAMDARTTKFGFREWDWHASHFTLNGVPWYGRADTSGTGNPDADMALYKKHGQNMVRFWGEDGWDGLDTQAALDYFDSHGMPVRRTGIFDGEAGGYNLADSPILFDNWRTQLAAWVKGQRNHPSIFIWSMENEITFINGHNWGHDDITQREMKKAWDLVSSLDPTRPAMTDGGNALPDQSLPVYGCHYMEAGFNDLPNGAYDLSGFAHRQPQWPITEQKPIFLGETFYWAGNELSDLATVGGESAFVGKAESYPAVGMIGRMFSEGYRWSGLAAFHFWGGNATDLYYNSWQPIAVLCRQWDSTFASGQKVPRTLGIFNDTHFAQPVSLAWTLDVGGKKIAGPSTLHTLAPGSNEKFSVLLPMPAVASRADGTWTLTLSVHGKPVFQDVRPILIVNTAARTARLYHRRLSETVQVAAPSGPALAVYDPYGTAAKFLAAQGAPFVHVADLKNLPTGAKALVVGKDALTPAQSTSSALAAYAAGGHTVIVLEQKNPLKFQALPAQMDPGVNGGSVAFSEDLGHPIFHDLDQRSLLTWGDSFTVYRNAYGKPTSGGKSLVECDSRLQDTALAEIPAGKGLMLVSQLLIGEKLPTEAAAQKLLLNMISYGEGYRAIHLPVTAVAGDSPPLVKALDATGLQYAKGADALAAVAPGSPRIAIIHATPVNLHALASNPAKVSAFTDGGGWIVFNDLTPEGLADYNKIVGVNHLIRPYGHPQTNGHKGEKVTFAAVRNPLTAGLPTQDVVIGSGQQIFNFAAGQYADDNAFSYVVDYDDVAPFGTSPWYAFGNIVSGFSGPDGWPLIINFPGPDVGKTTDIPITLPRPEKITQVTYAQNLNYNPTSKIAVLFDGGGKVTADLPNTSDPQVIPVSPPHTAKDVTLQIADWGPRPGNNGNVGIDNVRLKAYRSPEFYQKVHPMLNIGALMEYPQGAGGVVLCNVKYQDSEGNPENAGKKQAILATILRNLNAPFSGGKTIIAGANNLSYVPLDLSKQANQYRTDQGWFGDKNFTFTDLPSGKQTFAGARYNVYHFTTSPVPEAVMLGGGGIPGNLPDHVDGIPVNQKADALFFLQAARIDQRRNNDEIKQGKKPEMADYVIHYADGTTEKAPVYSEISVDDYKQAAPAALPGAQIAWTKPYGTTGQSAVAYSMQWNNPHPDKVIATIDFVYGPDRRGVPALLAVTAAKAQ